MCTGTLTIFTLSQLYLETYVYNKLPVSPVDESKNAELVSMLLLTQYRL